jgi:hypothetical protein
MAAPFAQVDAAAERPLSEAQKEALKFLERDFNQCFNQLRHYDGQIFELCKFAFVGYTTLIGAALGLYEFGLKEQKDFTLAIAAILTVGFLLGVFLFALNIRNRVYFVQVARYINEQRELFFALKPLGFANRSRMYTDPAQPPFFNWKSSQAWHSYIIAALNAVLCGVLLYVLISPATGVGVGAGLFLVQVLISVSYLQRREKKTAEEAVFGKPKSLLQ